MAGASVDVVARTYHTENGVEHFEGDTYAVADRALAETLYGIGFVGIDGWTDTPPAPTLATLTPATAAVGDANFTLHVIGAGFVASDAIVWNGAPAPTTFVSDTELTTPIDMAAIAAAGDVPVSVRGSNVLTFAVTPAP